MSGQLPLVVLCTVPDEQTGQSLGRSLVERQLAACVNVVPGLTSIYRWKGKIEQDKEALLFIKTQPDRFEALSEAIQAEHPYEVPEILALSATAGLEAYCSWVREMTRG